MINIRHGIYIYNSLTNKKQKFVSIEDRQVRMYTCGQTTYNDIHIGNARFYVVFDTLRRYLVAKGYNIDYVQNFTDIDDKIIQKANEEGITTQAIAARYIKRTLEDLKNLNVEEATVNPCVTKEIPEIISFIKDLIARRFAYEKEGTVFFEVARFKKYGKLSNKKIQDLEAGARVEINENKKSPFDFVLWKPAKEGEPSFESPWGDGRPGWHIECSAMIRKYLGDQIDIHGGGEDLIFPHHENEIAQTGALTRKKLANYWMHCGVLTVDHKKMSKSRGNFTTLRDVAKKFPYDVIRFYLLSAHYRSPLEFNDDVLKAAEQGYKRIAQSYKVQLEKYEFMHLDLETYSTQIFTPEEEAYMDNLDRLLEKFFKCLDDDFNTADAISVFFELTRIVNTYINGQLKNLRSLIQLVIRGVDHSLFMADTLGLAPSLSARARVKDDDENIGVLVEARTAAKKAKDFAEADRIRDELAKMGIVIEDTREGVRWHRA